jgi:hypothetical protein
MLRRLTQVVSRQNLAVVATVLLFLAACVRCYPATVVVVREKAERSGARQVEIAARFYGIRLVAISAGDAGAAGQLGTVLRQKDTVAVVIEASVLSQIDAAQMLAWTNTGRPKPLPFLIDNVTPTTDGKVLGRWSAGAVVGCAVVVSQEGGGTYQINAGQTIAPALSNQEIPASSPPACGFVSGKAATPEVIATFSAGNKVSQTFVRSLQGKQEVFLAADPGEIALPRSSALDQFLHFFAEIAPQMVFVQYAAGDQAWHAPTHYANLTVDDVWLTEPYGHLSFSSALREMEKHDFHITLAFIPWNFDRSEPGVAMLIRQHPDRFSVCVHGDDHDHMEFLAGREDDHPTPIPVSVQARKLQQALARMERFKALTGIPYDSVMVFPHEKYPESILELMKRDNYLAAANASTVPHGSVQPTSPVFFLEPATFSFADFPVIRRYSIEGRMPESLIAIRAFLGNPLLFYGHQDYFGKGPGAFDGTADMVNRLQPDVVWASLGEIARHLYRIRRRDDGDYDVSASTSDFWLTNDYGHVVTFHIVKEENYSDPIAVSVDGKPVSYTRGPEAIRLTATVTPGERQHIVIAYANHLDLASVEISRSGWRVRALRWAADFRDLILPRLPLGDRITTFYYDDMVRAGLTASRVLFLCCIITAILILAVARRIRKHAKRARIA